VKVVGLVPAMAVSERGKMPEQTDLTNRRCETVAGLGTILPLARLTARIYPGQERSRVGRRMPAVAVSIRAKGFAVPAGPPDDAQTFAAIAVR
jgi:hypothetical protein